MHASNINNDFISPSYLLLLVFLPRALLAPLQTQTRSLAPRLTNELASYSESTASMPEVQVPMQWMHRGECAVYLVIVHPP